MELLENNRGLQKVFVKKLLKSFKVNNHADEIGKMLDDLYHSPWKIDFDILEVEAEKYGFYFDSDLGTFLPEF